MGLFSSKKKVSVSSTLYNLAGAIEDRVQYLPSVIASKVIAGTAPSLGEAIQNSLITGPGMRFRKFAKWARTSGYTDSLGIKQGQLSVGNSIDLTVLANTIPHASDEVVAIQTAEIGIADYGYWADQWMSENHPTEIDQPYEIDFDELSNTITLTFTDGKVYTFSPSGFDSAAMYLYVSYMLTKGRSYGALVLGNKTPVDSESQLPSTDKYTLVSDTSTPKNFSLTDTVETKVTYSDNRPPETSTTSTPKTVTYTEKESRYRYEESLGLGLLRLSVNSRIHYLTLFREGGAVSSSSSTSSTETIENGVIKTTTKTTTTWTVQSAFSYREDYQDSVISSWSNMKVLIYKQNSGNATYDAFFAVKESMGDFLPFIPLREWNTFLSESFLPDIYEDSVKAVDRALNKKHSYLIDQLKDNKSIGDIDFAYLSFGVSLNTKENACKKYIYKFFQLLNQYGAGGSTQYNKWKTDWATANRIQTNWVKWRDAQADKTNPLYGTPEPDKATYPQMPTRNLLIYSQIANYNMNMIWSGITETTFTGKFNTTAKTGDVVIRMLSSDEYSQLMVSGGITGVLPIVADAVGMYWQDGPNTYRVLTVTGMAHINTIYKGKNVGIGAAQALADPEESGFLVPLHEGVYRSISLKDATQMSTACSYMVLNSYTVTKQKWYSSSWFKVVLIVVVIVISVLTYGGGAAAGAGLLGTAASVGAAVGLTGVAAIVAGAAINAIAGMIVAQLIMAGSTALLGDKVGAIVGAIASVLVVSVGTSLANGGTAAQGLANASSSVNLLKMTSSVGNGIAQASKSEFADVQKQIEQLQKDYQKEISAISAAWAENLGSNGGTIDIAELTSAISTQYESASGFLSRTLMLGSDIADLTNGLIGSLADITLSNELPV